MEAILPYGAMGGNIKVNLTGYVVIIKSYITSLLVTCEGPRTRHHGEGNICCFQLLS